MKSALTTLTNLVNAGCIDASIAFDITEDLAAGVAPSDVHLWAFIPGTYLPGSRITAPMIITDRRLTLEYDFTEIIADKLQVRVGCWVRLEKRWFLDGEEITA